MAVATTESEPRETKERPLYKRGVVVRLLIVALLAEVGYAVLNISTMPVYLATEAGPHPGIIPEGRSLGAAVISFVLVAFLLSEALLKSPMGVLADRIGPKRLMMIGPWITVGTSLITAFIPLSWGVWQIVVLIALRIGDGIGAAMLWPAAFSLMGESVEDDKRQEAMSLLNMCYMLGIALAPLIGGFVDDETGHKWSSLFLSAGLFACVGLAVIYLIPAKPVQKQLELGEQGIGFGDLLHSIREVPLYLILSLVTFIGIGFPMVVVKLFAQQEFGMSELGFGGLVCPAAITMAALGFPLTKYGKKIGKARAVHVGMGLCTFGLAFACLGAFFPFFRAAWALGLGGLPIGLGFLLAIPAWTASVIDLDPYRRGANVGAVMAAQGVGAIIGAPIGGALYEKLIPLVGVHIAHYSPFIGCMTCIGIGWILSLRLLHDKSHPPVLEAADEAKVVEEDGMNLPAPK